MGSVNLQIKAINHSMLTNKQSSRPSAALWLQVCSTGGGCRALLYDLIRH